ncbi:MAG: 6-pyruvoyl-tetrahydropterin synthase-related protein [Candidatus Levyibacteriota bacterium]
MYKKLLIVTLLAMCLVPVLGLFHSGLPFTHDGQDHVARIANFYLNLSEGNVIPRWAPNLNWGYGHPVLEFLYPLPSYIASLFHFMGYSLIDSTKIVFGLGMVLSGIFMFMWLAEFLRRGPAFVGAILYMYAPYRFVDLYVRGDIGENLAFAFMPVSLYFILKLSKKINAKYVVLGSISVAFLVLSHNAISLIYMPFLLVYGTILGFYKKDRKDYLISLGAILVFGLALSAFFWIPGLIEAKYTLRNIVTKGAYLERFVDIKSLFYGPWSFGGTGEFTLQIGILHLLFLILSPVLFFWNKRKKENVLILSLVAYSILAIFIMLPVSDFIWSRFIILQNFQFPWRFLAITVFSTSALAALVFSKIPAKLEKISLIVFTITILLLSKDYWHAQGYLQKPEQFFTGIYNSTTDTGESGPIWSVRFMEKRAAAEIEVISGDALVQVTQRKATKHVYTVDVKTSARFRENTLYFPGWKVLVDSQPVEVQFQDRNSRGLITFPVDRGVHIVEVIYTETKLRLFADLISAAALLLVLSYNRWSNKLWRRFL